MKTRSHHACKIVVPQTVTDKHVINHMMEQDLHFVKDIESVEDRLTGFNYRGVRSDGMAEVKFDLDMDGDGRGEHTLNLQCVLEEVREPDDQSWYSLTIELPNGEMIDPPRLFGDPRFLATLLGIDPSNYPSVDEFGGRWIDISDVVKELNSKV